MSRWILRWIALCLGFPACDLCERIDVVEPDAGYALGWRVSKHGESILCPCCAEGE